MKGVSYIKDSHKKVKAVQIDISLLEKYNEQLEDLIDVIIAESRVDEPSVPFERVEKSLRKKGKI
ncbi:MAG: hypothetical protein HY064_08550 [Bacteroidetes bacterium]|nr:hypothetical protein [Bacteroidota bacterium]